MATYGHTFTSGDTVTPTKLNNARTVSDIVNADISATAAIAATKLASDSITNTQIKSDAAIAGTKISPNFGSQNILSSSSSANSPALTLANSAVDGTGPLIVIRKQRGSSAAADGDSCGALIGQINDGTNNESAAFVGMNVEGTPSTGSVSANISFVTRETTGALTTRMRVRANGRVGINTTSPSSQLHVAGDLTVSSATTATAATAGTNGDVPAQVAGYLVVSINGTSRKIPYYAT